MQFTLRLALYIFATGLLIAGLLILISGSLLRASLPQYDGEAPLFGLSSPVFIDRDALGSVTFRGKNRLDLALAMGYVHAQERFFEMDLMRR